MGKHHIRFQHFRTDLGEGIRTGVYFDSCYGSCSGICVPCRFLREHPFGEDTTEQFYYTEKELADYLMEEKIWCYTKPLGITFLGKEPLADPFYAGYVGKALKNAKMNLHIHTCGDVSLTAFDMLREVTDLFVFNLFSPASFRHKPYDDFSFDRVMKSLRYLDQKEFSYRIRIPILEGVNADCPGALAGLVASLDHVKSTILDFSHIDLSPDETEDYRDHFRRHHIILY